MGPALPRTSGKYLLLLPGAAFLAVFFLVPLCLVVVHSFYISPSGAGMYEPGFTLDNYLRLVQESYYAGRVVATLKFGIIVTAITAVIGYPLAYYLARGRSLVCQAGLVLLLGTLYVTYVIRAFAWSVILSDNGVVNTLLHALGAEGVSLYPGTWAVVAGLIYSFYPFYVITVFATIRNIDPSLEEASQALGAGRLRTFWYVTLPLSKYGIMAGSMWVFVLTVGSFVNPVILGKPRDWFLPVIIEQQVQQELNVPFGSVLSLVLMAIVALTVTAVARTVGLRRVWRQ